MYIYICMCKILILYIQDSWTYPTMEHLRNPTREKSWGVVGCMPWWQDLGDDAWNGGRGKIPQQCGQPNAIHLPFTECFIHTNQKDGDDLGMVYYWVVHINMLFFLDVLMGMHSWSGSSQLGRIGYQWVQSWRRLGWSSWLHVRHVTVGPFWP